LQKDIGIVGGQELLSRMEVLRKYIKKNFNGLDIKGPILQSVIIG
jgi:hypothetical protein